MSSNDRLFSVEQHAAGVEALRDLGEEELLRRLLGLNLARAGQ